MPTGPWMKRPNLYELPTYRPQESVQAAAQRRFVWIPVDVIESSAWRSLSINARRIIDRLLLENFRHMAVKNGQLRVSARQFAECGVGMRLVSCAVAELVDAGLIAVTKGLASGRFSPRPISIGSPFTGILVDGATWTGDGQKEANPMPVEKISAHPQKVRRAHPQKVRRGTPICTPISLDGEAKIAPPKGETSIIYSGDGWSGVCTKGTIPHTVLAPEPAPRALRVEAYAIAHANWIRRFGLPTNAEVATLPRLSAMPCPKSSHATACSATLRRRRQWRGRSPPISNPRAIPGPEGCRSP